MPEGRRAAVGALLTVNLLTSCSSGPEAPQPLNVSDLETMHVACMDVSGLPFTDESCEQLAKNVEAGLRVFSEQTGNAIKPPRSVTHRRYSEVVQIEDAFNKRCTPLNHATRDDVNRVNDFMFSIASAALKQAVDLDFSKTGLYVGANAPVTDCPGRSALPQKTPSIVQTERCPEDSPNTQISYPGARAMPEFGKAVIFGFTGLKPVAAAENTAHERGHLGQGAVRLGHEYIFCNPKDDNIPSVIGPKEQKLATDRASWRGSLMSYADGSIYIAPPHLAYLDVISESQIITPTESGTFTLREATQKQGLAAIQLPFSNQVIKDVLKTELVGRELRPDDYRIWLSKMPGRAELGVYAAPILDKQGKEKNAPPIFLIDTLGQNQSLTIEGDVKITKVSSGAGIVTFDLQNI